MTLNEFLRDTYSWWALAVGMIPVPIWMLIDNRRVKKKWHDD